ncbi:Uncharacterized protein PHSC3_000747 [Chlamydiales bacterium STE3]|nr:Uncharacterized protein PHSC3_000747 [Chlamydiales bacterium STE3]
MRSHKVFYFLFLSLCSFGCIRLYYFLTDDFRLSNITHDVESKTEWNFASLEKNEKAQLKEILNQEFTYLGKGAQVYAFASKDGQWVIKFFKFKHLKPSLFISLLPSVPPFKSFKEANIQRKKRKLEGVFAGYRIAYLFDKENSGLFYVHFNKTKDLHSTVTLIDKLGFKHKVDLDPTVFIVQKKGQTLRQTLDTYLQKGDLDTALQRVNQILDMYLSEYANGVWDRDHGISHNTGFIADKPLHLDVGKFSHDDKMKEKEVYKNDLLHVGYKISAWVKQNYPKYHPAILQGLEEHLSVLLNENAKVCQPS